MQFTNENKAVGRLSELLALERGYSPAMARQIRSAAALHDIGKLRISAEILEKSGKLLADEFEIVKTHTTKGAEILAGIQGEIGELARHICLYHHEKRDARKSTRL